MGLAVVVGIPYYFTGTLKIVPAMMALACICIRGFFTGPVTRNLNALIVESSRYTYLKDGAHIEGTVFSCSSMGMKLGIGSALCGWLLALGGYNGMADIQTDGALNMISFMYIGIHILIYTVMFLLVWRLDVEKVNKDLESAYIS